MPAKLFLDSGAYSARSKGATISLEQYAEFLKTYRKYIEVAAGLDVIYDAQATWDNQKKMEALGVDFSIPTFHIGEDPKWLRKYVENYDYIGLGGTASKKYTMKDRYEWLEEMWSEHLTDDDGFPLVKVHGFAATGVDIMAKYPWYSVDSTSWIMAAASGKALFCEHTMEGWDIVEVPISEKSPFKETRNQHYETLPPLQQEAVRKVVEAHAFDLEALSKDYKQRFLSNAKAYVDFSKTLKYRPYIRKQTSLFGGGGSKVSRKAVPAWEHLNFYLAGIPTNGMTQSLMAAGHNRLLSYHYILENDRHFTEARTVLDQR